MHTIIFNVPPSAAFLVAGRETEQVNGEFAFSFSPDAAPPFVLTVNYGLNTWHEFRLTPLQISRLCRFLNGCLISASVNRRGHTDQNERKMSALHNIFAGPSRMRDLYAAFQDWQAANADTMPLKNADKVALWLVAAVLTAMILLYLLPENETTIFLKVSILYWALTGTGLCILSATLLLFGNVTGQTLYEVVQGYKAAKVADDQLAAGGSAPAIDPGEWSYPDKPSPYLTADEKRHIAANTNPKLNEETGGKIKAGFAAGMTSAQIAARLSLSETLVRRYIGIFRRGENAALSVDLEV